MPLQDVTDVLYDPDFSDTFSLIRSEQLISSGGIATDGVPTTVANIIGVVVPDSGRALQRLGADQRVTDAIEIFTTYRLTTGNGQDEADRITWNGGNYVVVNVRDYSRFGVGFIEAVCDLTDVNPAPTLASGNDTTGNAIATGVSPAAAATQGFLGFGYVQYTEIASEIGATLSPNQRIPVAMTIDPAQTANTLSGPFQAFPFFDGQSLRARKYGDAYEVRLTVTANASITGGAVYVDCSINGSTQPTDEDQANLEAPAGTDERLSFKLKLFPKTVFVANQAKLFITSSVPVTIRNETLVIEPISAGA